MIDYERIQPVFVSAAARTGSADPEEIVSHLWELLIALCQSRPARATDLIASPAYLAAWAHWRARDHATRLRALDPATVSLDAPEIDVSTLRATALDGACYVRPPRADAAIGATAHAFTLDHDDARHLFRRAAASSRAYNLDLSSIDLLTLYVSLPDATRRALDRIVGGFTRAEIGAHPYRLARAALASLYL